MIRQCFAVDSAQENQMGQYQLIAALKMNTNAIIVDAHLSHITKIENSAQPCVLDFIELVKK